MLIEIGIIALEDIQLIVENMDVTSDSEEYLPQYDLVQFGVVALESVQYAVVNMDKIFIIEEFGNI